MPDKPPNMPPMIYTTPPTLQDFFLKHIFRNKSDKEVVLMATPRGNGFTHAAWPSPAVKSWVNLPTYFNISTVKPVIPGEFLCRKSEACMRCHVVALDDIGSKVDLAKLIGVKPTYKLETSEGNFQWVFAFIEPVDDLERVKLLMQAIADAGLTDSGSTGYNHLMRVPGSVNIKPGKNNFVSRITESNAGIVFDGPDGVADALGIVIDDEPPPSTATASISISMSLNALRGELYAINPDLPREVWFKAAAAVHNATGGSDEGRAIFEEWSRSGVKKYDDAETAGKKLWKSLGKPNGTVITEASLRHLAQKYPNPKYGAWLFRNSPVPVLPPGASLTPLNLNSEGPQPLIRETPKGEPYPVDALGPFKQVVMAVQDKTQAPVAIAAQSALAVASLAVQALADVQNLVSSSPCSLYCLTIAQSGERKSSCDSFLMQAVRDHEAEEAIKYRASIAYHETELKMWEAKRNALLRVSTGKNAIDADKARADLLTMSAQPEPPLAPNRTATDPTFEGLVKLFAIGHPSLGIFTDEAGGFIGGYGMNGDNMLKTCAGLSSLWDGAPINRTRAGDGAITLRGRRLASHLMVQPIAAALLLADPVANSQGFLARFLMCEPESAIGTRTRRGHDPISDVVIDAFSKKLGSILKAKPSVREGTKNELNPRRLVLSAEAMYLLQQYYEDTELAQAADGSLANVRPYASKTAEQAARLASVMMLWEDPIAVEVTANTMANAITLAKYYLSEAARLANAAVISEKMVQAEMLRKWLIEKKSDSHILPSDILRSGPNSLREGDKVKAAIAILLEYGWLVLLPRGTIVEGKKRNKVYKLVSS